MAINGVASAAGTYSSLVRKTVELQGLVAFREEPEMSLLGRKDTGLVKTPIRCGLHYQVGRIPGKIMWR